MATPWANLTLCTVGDVETRVMDLQIAIPKNRDAIRTEVQVKINLVKEWMGYELQTRLAKLFPSTLAQVSRYGQFIYDSTRERLQALAIQADSTTILPTWFDPQTSYSFQLSEFVTSDVDTQVFYFNATPDASTFAGTARNGAFLCDMLHATVYINRGSADVPDWQLWTTTALVDYILNPSVLKDAAVAWTIYAVLTDAALRFQPDLAINSDLVRSLVPMYEKEYKCRLETAVSLLQIDSSGDGVWSEFDRTRTQDSNGWFA